MASRAPVHQNLKPETSCQHSTFGGAPSEFDFFDLPVKQQDETLVDAEMYTSTLTLKSFIWAQAVWAVERHGGSPGDGEAVPLAGGSLKLWEWRGGAVSRWAAGMHLHVTTLHQSANNRIRYVWKW